MKAQDLKNSILQLAVQGKLVEQDLSDEPACVLLERIREKRARLVKEKRIKTSKSSESVIYRDSDGSYYEKRGSGESVCVDDEIPFEIPDTWEWARLDCVANLFTGNSIPERVKASKYTGLSEGYEYIATKDLSFDGSFNYANGVRIPFNEDGFKIAGPDDILMCIEGGSAGRKIGMVERSVCFGNKLCDFSSYGLSQRYLYYFLQTPAFRTQFKSGMTGIIGGVSIKNLSMLFVSVPPFEEQVRIAHRLDELMSLIGEYDELERAREILDKTLPTQLRKTVLQMAVEGKLCKADENSQADDFNVWSSLQELPKSQHLFDIPPAWKWVSLGCLLEERPRNGYSPKAVSYKTSVKSFSLGATTSGVFDESHVKYIDEEIPEDSYLWLRPDDLLIQRSNTIDYVGTSCIFTGGSNDFIYPDLIMKARVVEGVSVRYVDLWLKSHYARRYFQTNAKGSAKNMPKINQKTVINCPVPLPPSFLQTNIAECVDDLLALINAIE